MQMDFLDPSRKKAHKRRLLIGYGLMSIVIALGTLLIFYLAYGFDIDRKTGNLIQNGIVFVDSKPKDAKVLVNNIEQRNRTDTRLVLPAGSYTIKIEKEGFRNWERTLDLSGGEIERVVYPFLIPNEFITTDISTYNEYPDLVTQSPDRRWLLARTSPTSSEFDMFDLNNIEKPLSKVAIPKDIYTLPKSDYKLKFVEWSTNNRHILFERIYGDKSEFIVFDRENPAQSINLNTLLGISPVYVSLKNKRPDQFYYLDAKPGVLRVADTKSKTISAPLLESVIDYKTYGDDIVLYATQKEVADDRTEFRILEGGNSYTLKNVSKSDNYVLDVSKYDNKWFYVAGSSNDNMAFVYEDPLSSLKRSEPTPLKVTAIMRLDNPRFVSFSAGTQFIGLQSGSKLLTIDLEKNHQYRINLEAEIPLEQEIKWMDGHRYLYSVNNQSYIVDFDGSNEQTLVTSTKKPGPFFDRDYDNVFTFEDSKSTSGKKALTMTVIDDR